MRMLRNVLVRCLLKEKDRCLDLNEAGADSRIVLEWDWSSEESRTVPVSVIRMSAMGEAQGLTEVRVLICRKLTLYGFVLLSHLFFLWSENGKTMGVGKEYVRLRR